MARTPAMYSNGAVIHLPRAFGIPTLATP